MCVGKPVRGTTTAGCGVSVEENLAGVSVEELWKALILCTAGLMERCVQSNAKALGLRCSMVCEGVRELCVSVV